mmetsp:Transcript_32557/g.58277  ORF Transcript_32557/g.58277 Transcript_32557/m.58277 type:complete len:178 (+) Transcript_32557:362-895(+)|eukprot:CAMPEP_0177769892 /NCGR_PEP_ID=MMETSP0491_2-20121128/10602_1 /TAXON_ID=63592 /ORGANISM="Tetraselmis chuii, Strain PLY429" /LENGTH=177 /DNA_ID=CAMNT_0019287007 /DNA_START=226 /DNA_END=759 /DNA_ORIENTATION=+
MAITPCTVKDTIETRQQQYVDVRRRLHPLLTGETDLIAAMATVVCELHHSFAYYNWTGFYRASGDGALVVGPYQGSHGCLRISPGNGVCGAAAAAKKTQLVPDVHVFPGHIACSSSSNSEIVVPLLDGIGDVLAVLDVDSDTFGAFTAVDQSHLEDICDMLVQREWATGTDILRARL